MNLMELILQAEDPNYLRAREILREIDREVKELFERDPERACDICAREIEGESYSPGRCHKECIEAQLM